MAMGTRWSDLSWKFRRFRCRPQLVLTTWCRVFPTRQPDTANVSATSCDVGFFFSVSYVVSLPNCRHVVVVCSLITYTINHSRYPELRNTRKKQRFSTLQLLLSCSLWRHTKNARENNTKHNHTTHNNQHEQQPPYPPAALLSLSPWVEQWHHQIMVSPLPDTIRRRQAVGLALAVVGLLAWGGEMRGIKK